MSVPERRIAEVSAIPVWNLPDRPNESIGDWVGLKRRGIGALGPDDGFEDVGPDGLAPLTGKPVTV
jgi:hypothetical protein